MAAPPLVGFRPAIHAVAVIGKQVRPPLPRCERTRLRGRAHSWPADASRPFVAQNNPLYVTTLGGSSELKFLYVVHSSLDIIEEKGRAEAPAAHAVARACCGV